MKQAYVTNALVLVLAFGMGCQKTSDVETAEDTRLTPLSERQDIWGGNVDLSDPPQFKDRVYWIDDEMLEGVDMIDGVFGVDGEHVLSELIPGDVFVSDWEGGYWMKVDRIVEAPAGLAVHTSRANMGDLLERGKLVARPADAPFALPNALAYCGPRNCAATVDLSLSNPSILQFADASGGVAIRAEEAELQYEPTIGYEAGVNSRGTYTKMTVSGSYSMSARFDVSSERPSTVRVSYPLPAAGGDSAGVSWRSVRNPAALPPETPAVPAATLMKMIESMPNMSGAYDAGPSLVITAPEGQMQVPYTFYDDSDPFNPSGGIDLRGFVTDFNEGFAAQNLRAVLVQGPGGYSATAMIFRDDPTNIALFSLLGRTFVARPHTDITFSASASRPGRIQSSFSVNGRVESGWICYEERGCSFIGQRTYPETTGAADSSVLEGEPWIDFRFQLNPVVEIERGNADFSQILAGGIKSRANFETQPPSCLNRDQLSVEQYARRLGRSFLTEDVELVDVTGVSTEVDGCTGTGDPPADCSICESSGTPNCVTNVCGEGMACYFGKCSLPADFDVTMTWDFSQPNVDLDLWVELPDGSLVHPGQLVSLPAEMANVSDGAVSSSGEDAGGFCEGEADRDCDQFEGTEEDCPDGCFILTEVAGGRCFNGPSACDAWQRDYYNCPTDCRVHCDPDTDSNCPRDCFQRYEQERDDYCYDCDGLVNIDQGCTEQTDRTTCLDHHESCGWSSTQGDSFCVGGRIQCDTLAQEMCERAVFCTWNQPPPVERLEFPPYMERVVLARPLEQPLKFWVVNKSGIDTGEQIPFEIAVRLRPDEDYKIQGFVGPNPGEQSIQYRYEFSENP